MKLVQFDPNNRRLTLDDALRRFPDLEFSFVVTPEELAAALPGAEILIASNRPYTAEVAKMIREKGTSLKWIQFATSGIDNGLNNGLPSGVVVTNVAGMRAFAVAEHAMFLMLGLVRCVRETEKARCAAEWSRDRITPSTDNLAGKHLVIIGMGSIGREIARRAKAFDMTVTAITRAREVPENFDNVRPRSDLIAAAAEADILAVAANYDETTDKIVGRDVLAAMKPTAFVVNVARGKLVDEAALIAALDAKKIAGAGLDVMAVEPLPPDSPLWTMDNVLMTPHIGGAGSQGIGGGFAPIVIDNLERYLAGKPLQKIVIERTP
jgi:phosphoglycerate dehydrogenase-like enzyme